MVQNITATFDGKTLHPDWAVSLRPNQRYLLTTRELTVARESDSVWHDLAECCDGSAET